MNKITSLTEKQTAAVDELVRTEMEKFKAWQATRPSRSFWIQVPPQQRQFEANVLEEFVSKLGSDGELVAGLAAEAFPSYIEGGGDFKSLLCSVPAMKECVFSFLKNNVRFMAKSWNDHADRLGDGTDRRYSFSVDTKFWHVVRNNVAGWLFENITNVEGKQVGVRLLCEELHMAWGTVEVWLRAPKPHIEQLALKEQLRHQPQSPKPPRRQFREFRRQRLQAATQKVNVKDVKAVQAELRTEVEQEVAVQEPQQLAQASVTELVRELDRGIGTLGEALGAKLDEFLKS